MSFRIVVIKGGLVSSALLISYSVIAELIQNYRGETLSGSFQNLILAIGLFYSITEFKNFNKGILSLKEALKVGMISSFISGLLFGIFSWAYVKFYNSQVLEIILKQLKIGLEEKALEKSKFDEIMNVFHQIVTPEFLIFSSIFSCCLAGFFISILLGLFMKKNKADDSDLSFSDYKE